MRQKQHFQFKKIFDSKLFIIAILAVIVLLCFNLGRVLSKDYLVKKEISRLQGEVARLEAEQNRLTNLRDFFQSDFFIEQESRKSLGYAKEGEKVVVIEKGAWPEDGDKGESELSNPKKWWKYFFGPKS